METGIDPYLDVVIPQTTLLNSQQALINSQVAQMTACVQLIAALGWEWDQSQLPTPAQVTKRPNPPSNIRGFRRAGIGPAAPSIRR
jgi:hypothetical protein